MRKIFNSAHVKEQVSNFRDGLLIPLSILGLLSLLSKYMEMSLALAIAINFYQTYIQDPLHQLLYIFGLDISESVIDYLIVSSFFFAILSTATRAVLGGDLLYQIHFLYQSLVYTVKSFIKLHNMLKKAPPEVAAVLKIQYNYHLLLVPVPLYLLSIVLCTLALMASYLLSLPVCLFLLARYCLGYKSTPSEEDLAQHATSAIVNLNLSPDSQYILPKHLKNNRTARMYTMHLRREGRRRSLPLENLRQITEFFDIRDGELHANREVAVELYKAKLLYNRGAISRSAGAYFGVLFALVMGNYTLIQISAAAAQLFPWLG